MPQAPSFAPGSMTIHEPDLHHAHLTAAPHFGDAHHVSRHLVTVVCIYAAGIVVLSSVAWGLGPAAWQTGLAVLRQTGAIGDVLAAITIALGVSLSCLIMVGIRRRAVASLDGPPSRRLFGHSGSRPLARHIVGMRAPALLVIATAGGGAVSLAALRAQAADAAPATATWFALAGVSMLAAFPLLVAERVLSAVPVAFFPELPRLKPAAVLPIACLALLAAADVASGLGLDLARPAAILLAAGLFAVSAELAVRAALALISPAPDPAPARAPIDSLLLRSLGPAIGRPASWSAAIRERFGIDFGRSWALRYIRRAAAPVVLTLVLLCVFLTGVTRIDSNERGIYERLGLPVAVLRPGLHLILPWPLGRIRRTEYGVVHAVPVSYGTAGAASDPFLDALSSDAAESPGVDGPAPASANRLWDSDQPSDVSYIISSDSRGRQSFETVSVSMRVLWRVGLDDASARRAVYAVMDHDGMVRKLGSQLLARYLASRTLPQLLGEDRASITRSIQTGLQQMLDKLGAGVEVVAVIVEAMHPPGGAATAYRNVQAAEITANAEISAERGRAEITTSLARRDAAEAVDAATAAAAERLSAAQIVRTNLRSDAAAYHNDGGPFLLERYLAQLSATLPSASVEILDHRLGASDGPTLDLRPFDRIGDANPPRGSRPMGNGENAQ
jgi:regulator of protease activity HflC (stomatin/prohibitin superfamily)